METQLILLSDLLKRHLNRHETATIPSRRSARACDACHAGKSKCSGVPPCSLCVKRGISCSFDEGKGAVSTQAVVGTYQTPRSPTPTTSPERNSLSDGRQDTHDVSSHNAAFLRALIIRPTPPDAGSQVELQTKTEKFGETLTPQDKMMILFRAIESRMTFRFEQITEASAGFGIWVSTCCSSYFDRFHLYWPVLHRPSFDAQKDSLMVSATVVIIGAWLTRSESSKPHILEIHKLLVDQFFEHMV